MTSPRRNQHDPVTAGVASGTDDENSPRRSDAPLTRTAPPPPVDASSAETWSSFTQVVALLQECELRVGSTPPPPPEASATRRKRPRDGDGQATADEVQPPASPSASDACVLPVPWSAEWVMLVWLKAILLCPLCRCLLRDKVAVVETCGHAFCQRCLLTAIEDGCEPMGETWPYNVVLFRDEETDTVPSSTATSEAHTPLAWLSSASLTASAGASLAPPDLLALGRAMAHRQRRLQRNASLSGRRPRRRRKITLACPLCSGPAFKWTSMRLPLLEQVCAQLDESVPDLEARLQALEEPSLPPRSSAHGEDATETMEVISVSSTSAASLPPVAHVVSSGDRWSHLVSAASVKTEAESDLEAEAEAGMANEACQQVDPAEGEAQLLHVSESTRARTPPPLFSVPLFVAPEPSRAARRPGENGEENKKTAVRNAVATSVASPTSASLVLAHADSPRPDVLAAPSSLALLGAVDDMAMPDELDGVNIARDLRQSTPPPPLPPQPPQPTASHGAYRNLLYSDTP